jgi:hypothetical protein
MVSEWDQNTLYERRNYVLKKHVGGYTCVQKQTIYSLDISV